MKLLVYGFKPYDEWKENISEKVVKRIRKRKNLKKVIFPVKFWKKQFLNEIKRSKPSVILGLGQHPRGRIICIERRAVNLRRHNKRPKILFRGKPRYRSVSLKLKNDRNSRISYNAGKYICNYSMYVISDKNIPFAFIHIPRNYNVKKVTKFVEGVIRKII